MVPSGQEDLRGNRRSSRRYQWREMFPRASRPPRSRTHILEEKPFWGPNPPPARRCLTGFKGRVGAGMARQRPARRSGPCGLLGTCRRSSPLSSGGSGRYSCSARQEARGQRGRARPIPHPAPSSCIPPPPPSFTFHRPPSIVHLPPPTLHPSHFIHPSSSIPHLLPSTPHLLPPTLHPSPFAARPHLHPSPSTALSVPGPLTLHGAVAQMARGDDVTYDATSTHAHSGAGRFGRKAALPPAGAGAFREGRCCSNWL